MSVQAVISSEGWGLFPLSLAVGRGQFLVVVGLRPCAPRGCLATWPLYCIAFCFFKVSLRISYMLPILLFCGPLKKPQSD